MTLSAAERAHLAALAEAATPGPWHMDTTNGYDEQDREIPIGWIPEAGLLVGDLADAAFIAAARDAVPRLLAALDAAEAAQQTTLIPCAGCSTGVRPAAGRYCAACQERLEQEAAAWKCSNDEWLRQATWLARRVAALEVALKPLARLADMFPSEWDDSADLLADELSLGDARRARALLGQGDG